jgi:hypothetical protein
MVLPCRQASMTAARPSPRAQSTPYMQWGTNTTFAAEHASLLGVTNLSSVPHSKLLAYEAD